MAELELTTNTCNKNRQNNTARHSTFFRCICVVVFLLLIRPFFGHGQDQAKIDKYFEMSIVEFMEVEVKTAGRFSQKLSEAPAGMVIITDRQIRERGYKSLGDVLRDVPGFDIVENCGRFGEYYIVRGVDGNDRLQVLLDGHRINPFSGTFLSVGQSIAVGLAERIEIIYGPASAVYGADAFAGIINIISKPFDGTKKTRGELSLSYGSFNTVDAKLEFQFPFHKKKNRGLTAFGRLFNSDGLDLVGRDPLFDVVGTYTAPAKPEMVQPIRDYNIFVKTQWDKFIIGYYRQRFNQGNSAGLRPEFYIYNKDNRWGLVTDILWCLYENTFYKKSHLTMDISYTSHVQDPGTQFLKLNLNQYMTGEDRTYKGMITFKHDFNQYFHTLVGVEYENTRSIPAYANDEVLGGPFKYEGAAKEAIKEQLTIRETRAALFVRAIIKPISFFHVTAGLRYDFSSLNEETINPSLGAVLKAGAGTTFKFLFGTAFQAPSLFYKYEQFGAPNLVMLPNRDLDNQKLKTYEISMIQKLGKYLLLHASLYYNDLKDLIVRVPLEGLHYNKYFDTYTPGISNANIGSQVGKGLNLMLDIRLNQKLAGFITYGYTDASYTITTENPLPRVSEHKLSVGVSFRGWHFMTVTPRIKWVSPINRAITNPDYMTSKKQPGFLKVDLFLRSHEIIRRTRFFLRLENIFNRDIRHAGIFGQSEVYLPEIIQPKFTFSAGFDFTF
ncbi:MAG: TonB-dependent receptor [bacterium]|nr:TonB-dependent receptor [bacterium]